MRKHTSLGDQQSGLVSIIVTMMLMVVITLIVLGFARASRREQRQALDRQLSTQAFYAAESGVNDAVKILKDNPTAQKTGCDSSSWSGLSVGYTVPSSDINTATNSSYTCLLVSSNQDSLQYGTVGYKAQVIPINADSDVRSVTISWQGKTSGVFSGCPSGPTISQPDANTWSATCGPGLIRFDLVPLGVGTGLTRANLVSGTMTAFLYPRSGGSSDTLTYAGATGSNQGQQAKVVCSGSGSPYECTISITAIPAGNTKLQLRIQSFYKDSQVDISANGGGGVLLGLKGAQIKIDSTGKANDVLRRVQVRVPLSPSNTIIGDFAVQAADDLCKQFRVGTGFYDNNSQSCSDP